MNKLTQKKNSTKVIIFLVFVFVAATFLLKDVVLAQTSPTTRANDPYKPSTAGVSRDIQILCEDKFNFYQIECEFAYADVSTDIRQQYCRKQYLEQCYKDEKTADDERTAQNQEAAGIRANAPDASKTQQLIRNEVAGLNKIGLKRISDFFGRGISVIMGILGTIALVMFMYGGVLWMTARGNGTQIETAIKVLVWSALGVAIILTSYTIVDFFFQAFV